MKKIIIITVTCVALFMTNKPGQVLAGPCLHSINNKGVIFDCCNNGEAGSIAYNPSNGYCSKSCGGGQCYYDFGGGNWQVSPTVCNTQSCAVLPTPTPTLSPGVVFNPYDQVIPGVTTKDQVTSLLGSPTKIDTNQSLTIYWYKADGVNFHMIRIVDGIVDTITIFLPSTIKDVLINYPQPDYVRYNQYSYATRSYVYNSLGLVLTADDSKTILIKLKFLPNTAVQFLNKWSNEFFENRPADGLGSVTTIESKSGDLNNDNKVNISDYNILLQNFGNTTCGNIADIDGNCNVNIFDYNTLVQNFGKTN